MLELFGGSARFKPKSPGNTIGLVVAIDIGCEGDRGAGIRNVGGCPFIKRVAVEGRGSGGSHSAGGIGDEGDAVVGISFRGIERKAQVDSISRGDGLSGK